MSYTIQSARYSHPMGLAAILQTTESGAVFASPERPQVWQAFQAWIAGGGAPQPYVAPERRRPRPLATIAQEIAALSQADRARLLNAVAAEFLRDHPRFAEALGISISGDEIEP